LLEAIRRFHTALASIPRLPARRHGGHRRSDTAYVDRAASALYRFFAAFFFADPVAAAVARPSFRRF
jgi:hypothetical protein